MSRATGRQGFALPMTLFLISIVTLMLTAAFAKVQSDRRIAESSGANVTALSMAKAGLQQYLGTRPYNTPGSVTSPWRPPGGDSIRIMLSGGYADVIARVVRKPADTLANWLYVIRSVGHVIDATQGADPTAVRTIAQFAQWQTGRIDTQGAYTSANQINIVTGTGGYEVIVSGYDPCLCNTAVAGQRGPTGTDNLPSYQDNPGSGTDWLTFGSPTNSVSLNKAQVAQGTNIDWATLIQGGFTPDYSSIQTSGADQWNYTSQMVIGNATLNGSGSGLLIVTGDLDINSSGWWNGIVLVGGTVDFNTNYNFYGALYSGLNLGLPSPPVVPKTDLGNHSVNIIYTKTYIDAALARLTGFAPITNGWVDNWAMY